MDKTICTPEILAFKHIPENTVLIDAVPHEIFLFFFYYYSPSCLSFPSVPISSALFISQCWLALVWLAGRSSTCDSQLICQGNLWEPELSKDVLGPSQ